MNETAQNESKPAARPEIPRARLWIMGALFLIVGIGMYAGTMYRIQNYGYVGVGADQPIKEDTQLHN
ncbi:hypothetical protein V5T82_13395 [Magnetovibrio sp. PR-2]|uniref:hypothetical protein n=1 Tax=Magnetovibrio sp. PR-2 TaxID=3120356 RepID=UPI002FCDF8C9